MKHTILSPQPIKRSTISIFFFICISLSASMILYSCSDGSTDPDFNSNGNGNGNNGGSTTIGTSPTFDNVGQILIAACADCHTSQQESGVRVNNYDNLMNSVGNQYGTEIVNPGSPETSPLIDKIESSNPSFGVRMPQGGPFLSSGRIDQIREWINNGAENDVSEDSSNNSSDDDGYN